jgi:hypothetical protein
LDRAKWGLVKEGLRGDNNHPNNQLDNPPYNQYLINWAKSTQAS